MKNIIKFIIPGVYIDQKIYLRYKISNFFWRKRLECLAKYISYRTYRKYNCIISYKANIRDKIKIPHPLGIVIGEGVEIGKGVTIYQNVTLGRKNKDIPEYPLIDDNVTIYANSTVIGKIKISNDAIIGCNSVVMRNIKKGEIVKGIVK